MKLPLSGCEWWSTVDLPTSVSPMSIIQEQLESKSRIVIRGADQKIANLFRSYGGFAIQSGMEAAIDLTNRSKDAITWNRKSNRELKRRALRYGQVIRHNSVNTFPSLLELRQRSVYRDRPALNRLFLTESDQWCRAYSFDMAGEVVGLLTLSQRDYRCYHTEILMRALSAPIGTMEALVLSAIEDLINEEAEELSLGECPFVLSVKPRLQFHLAEKVMRRTYNSKGLYNFKAKFLPDWRAVYLCSNHRFLLSVIDLFLATNVANLLFHNLMGRYLIRTV